MITNQLYDCPQVIVRSWGDKPVAMKLQRKENKTCYVGMSGRGKTIGLPSSDVFVYQDDNYLALKSAFERGELDKLSKLYASISVDDFTCNKYQDVLVSHHGQEDISDFEGITCSNR